MIRFGLRLGQLTRFFFFFFVGRVLAARPVRHRLDYHLYHSTQERRSSKKTALIFDVAPNHESAVDEMAEDENADKDFPVDAAADDRKDTTEEVPVEIITR